MKKAVKVVGGIIPFLATHLLCCGELLYFLWSSGLLLVLAKEGRSKVFLIPILAIASVFFVLHRKHKKACAIEGHMPLADKLLNIFFFLSFYLLFSLAFLIYIFIPWWIPGYDGGLILP